MTGSEQTKDFDEDLSSEDGLPRVLIVDDHPYNRSILRFILEDNNYECLEAENGQEALEAVQADPEIEMVLMDINMPVMDGLQASREIRNLGLERFLPIVFVTALDDDDTLANCLQAGGDDFVPKPVNENVLLAKMAANHRTVVFYRRLMESNKSLVYHKKLMDQEHVIVEHVFQNGMKRNDLECVNVRCSITPMSMFNGDLLLTAPNPSGGVYVLLGDFTGHGLSAAIGCLPVSDIFFAMTRKHADVGDIAYEMNRRLQLLLPSNMFCCAAIMELSVSGDRLSYWIGGINDVLLIGEQGGIQSRLSAQHMPLGILSGRMFDRSTDVISLNHGTRIFAYTDGVIEAANAEGELFGEERLEALFEAPADSYISRVTEAVEVFQLEQNDDISIVELLCVPVVHTGSGVATSPNDVAEDSAPLPWCMSFHLGPKELKEENIVSRIIGLLTPDASLMANKDMLYTLLCELLSNSLEHGILSMDSALKETPDGFMQYYELRRDRIAALEEGFVNISLRLTGTLNEILEIEFSDSGSGFDYEAKAAPVNDEGLLSYGRGMSLIYSLCESVVYSNGGRTVVVRYPLHAE